MTSILEEAFIEYYETDAATGSEVEDGFQVELWNTTMTVVEILPSEYLEIDDGRGPQGPPGAGANGPTGLTANGILGGHRLVVPTGADQVEYADKDDLTDVNKPVWLTTAAAVDGAPVSLGFYGQITESSWTWSVGPLYVGSNGLLTQVAPTTGYLRQIGTAIEPTVIWMDPHPAIILA